MKEKQVTLGLPAFLFWGHGDERNNICGWNLEKIINFEYWDGLLLK